jgi:hypothetical protein
MTPSNGHNSTETGIQSAKEKRRKCFREKELAVVVEVREKLHFPIMIPLL